MAYLKALIVAIKKIDKEREDNKQSNLSNNKVLDKDVGININNIIQLIK